MQLVYPIEGILTVTLPQVVLTATPYRGVLIGSWVTHHVAAPGQTVMRSVFIHPDQAPDVDNHQVISVSPLLHELVAEAGNYFGDAPPDSIPAQIVQLTRALISDADTRSHMLALPRITHPRLGVTAEALLNSSLFPALAVDQVAHANSLSARHFRRLFKHNTGMNFSLWRSIARIKVGLELLSQGYSVSRTASHTGYSSASAFGYDFKKHTGMTPSQYTTTHQETSSRRR